MEETSKKTKYGVNKMTRRIKPTEEVELVIAKAFFDPEAKWETRHEQFVSPEKKKAHPPIAFCPSDIYKETQRTISTINYRNYRLILEEVTDFFSSQDDVALHADVHERITTTRGITELVVTGGGLPGKLVMESRTKDKLISQILPEIKDSRSFERYLASLGKVLCFNDFYSRTLHLDLSGVRVTFDIQELETTPEIDNFKNNSHLYSGRPRVDVWQALHFPQNHFWQPYKIRLTSPPPFRDVFPNLKDLDGTLVYRVAQRIQRQIADEKRVQVFRGVLGYDRMATTEQADNLIECLREYINSGQRIREEVEILMNHPYRLVKNKLREPKG